MRTTFISRRIPSSNLAVVIVAALLLHAVHASAQSTTADCATGRDPVAQFYKQTPRNTFEFNHRELRSSTERLAVLEVDHGGFFQIVFTCTAPAYFNYTVTGDPGAQPASTTGGAQAESVMVSGPLTSRGITMRHDSQFLRYRVSATIRPGIQSVDTPTTGGQTAVEHLPPVTQGSPTMTASTPTQLFAVSFDVWVVTKPDWRLSIIGGVAASSLVDTKYAIATDAQGVKTFVESPTGQSSKATDVMALANVYYSQTFFRTVNLGAAFGIGSSGTAPRFFFGPSVVFGRYFVLTGGWSIGSVAAPPLGQELGRPPVNGDNTLNSLTRRVNTRSFVGIGFTWIDRKDQFAAALSAAASASGAVGSCVTSVTPAEVAFTAAVPSPTVAVKAGADCVWSATIQSGGDHFQVVSGGSGKGDGTITLKAGAAGATPRADVLNVVGPSGSAAKAVKLNQAAAK